MSYATSFLNRVYDFANIAHRAVGQVRKYTGDPYVYHTKEVRDLVGEHHRGVSKNVLAAAYLHDVLEDTKLDAEFLKYSFGGYVTRLVVELTELKYPDLPNRAARKAAEVDRISKISKEAKIIKLADLVSNTRTIVQHDPKFAAVYLVEKKALLEVLQGVCPSLHALALKQVNQGLYDLT
jgi:(p)ppGpp synthase/HD superfamily hydrolase